MGPTLYFLRHGETEDSQTHGFCGDLDVELTPEGHQMAADFAEAYKSMPWTAVYCSPMRRTLETARPLCDMIGLEIQLRDGLKEISYGQWEGKDPDEVNRTFHDDYLMWMSDPAWNRPPGGERGVDVARRSSVVLDEIDRNHSSGNVLVISHKATTRIIVCSLLGIDVGRYRDRIGMPVASLCVVEMTEQGPLLRALGDRAHLRESLRQRPGT